MAHAGELVTIGQIVKAFGVRGDARVRSLSDVPGRYEGLREVTLESPSGRRLSTVVTRVRGTGASYVLGFEAFSSPEEVAAFRGGWIKIPKSDSPSLPAGQYYESDLIGLQVIREDGVSLGGLEEILDTGGQHVFVVRGEHGEILLPATKEIIQLVDVSEGIMRVRPPEGLLPREWSEQDAV